MNQVQLIAATGLFRNRTHPDTQRLLDRFKAPQSLTYGWGEEGPYEFAFRKAPTGVDASNRPGAFFCHALVWSRGALAYEFLQRLGEADIWVTSPPPRPPRELAVIQSIEELGIRESQDGAHGPRERAAIGRILRSFAAGRQVALNLPCDQAVALAGCVAAQLPPRFGLVSFTCREPESATRERYDIVGGPAEGSGWDEIALTDATTDAAWDHAASIVQEGSAGETTAAGALEVLETAAGSRAEFCRALHVWAKLEETVCAAEVPDGGQVALLTSDRRLVRRAVACGGARSIAMALPDGEPPALIRALVEADVLPELNEHLLEAFGSPPSLSRALAALERMASVAPDVVRTLLPGLTTRWRDGEQLDALHASDWQRLVRLVAGHVSFVPPVLAEPFAARSDLATLIGRSRLPVDFRVQIAIQHAERLRSADLAQQCADDPRFASLFLVRADPHARQALNNALSTAPLGLARECASVLASVVPRDARDDLLWPVFRRLNPEERLNVADVWAPSPSHAEASWADAFVDAYVQVVDRHRRRPAGLPDLAVVGRRLVDQSSSEDPAITAWLRLLRVLGEPERELTDDTLTSSLAAAAQLASPWERDVARDAVLDACARRLPSGLEAWNAALVHLEDSRASFPTDLAIALGWAALRPHANPWFTLHTIMWLGDQLGAKRISARALADMPFGALSATLTEPQRVSLAEVIESTRSRRVRRWLREQLGPAGSP